MKEPLGCNWIEFIKEEYTRLCSACTLEQISNLSSQCQVQGSIGERHNLNKKKVPISHWRRYTCSEFRGPLRWWSSSHIPVRPQKPTMSSHNQGIRPEEVYSIFCEQMVGWQRSDTYPERSLRGDCLKIRPYFVGHSKVSRGILAV